MKARGRNKTAEEGRVEISCYGRNWRGVENVSGRHKPVSESKNLLRSRVDEFGERTERRVERMRKRTRPSLSRRLSGGSSSSLSSRVPLNSVFTRLAGLWKKGGRNRATRRRKRDASSLPRDLFPSSLITPFQRHGQIPPEIRPSLVSW